MAGIWDSSWLWMNRDTGGFAFNILKREGAAQHAALGSTGTTCYLQVAGLSPRGPYFSFPLEGRTPGSGGNEEQATGRRLAAGSTSAGHKLGLRLLPELSRGFS